MKNKAESRSLTFRAILSDEGSAKADAVSDGGKVKVKLSAIKARKTLWLGMLRCFCRLFLQLAIKPSKG